MTRPPKPRHLWPVRQVDVADDDRTLERIKTATKLCDEPEAISPAILNGYTESAHFHQTIRHQQSVAEARKIRPLLKAEDRLVDAMRRAKQAHRSDLSHEFHVLKLMLERAEKGGRKPPAPALARLERVEASLDGVTPG